MGGCPPLIAVPGHRPPASVPVLNLGGAVFHLAQGTDYGEETSLCCKRSWLLTLGQCPGQLPS